MDVQYQFVFDWPFYRTALARYRRQRPNRFRKALITGIGAAVVAFAWLYAHVTNANWYVIPEFVLIGGFAGGAIGFVIDKIILPIRIRRSPEYGAKIAVTLSDEGLSAAEPQAQAKLLWTAFTRVVQMPDGILLLRGKVIRWLPHSALQNASPSEVLRFVRSKTNVVEIG